MPTRIQRIKAVADAVINGPATTAQINKFSEAHASRAGRLDEYMAATSAAERADIAWPAIRNLLIAPVREMDAAYAKRNADAAADAYFAELT